MTLLSAADLAGTVQQWNLKTGKLLKTLANSQNDVSEMGMFYPVAFSLDGKLMARGDADRAVRLWSLQTGTLLRILPGHPESAHAIAFSPDSRILATAGYSGRNEFLTGGNYHNLKLWDVQTGELLAKLEDTEYITALAFDPDGKTLFTGGDPGKVKLWNISRLKPKNNANLEAPK